MAAPQAWSWSNPTVFSTRASWLRWLETPATHRKRLTASARRALEMLATDFATEKIMLDQGFTSGLLTDLGRAVPHRKVGPQNRCTMPSFRCERRPDALARRKYILPCGIDVHRPSGPY